MKKGISKGLSDSHQSIIKEARPFIVKLKQESCVSKIIVGIIRNTPSKNKKIVSTRTRTSIRMVVKSKGEIQEFFVIGSKLNEVNKVIDKVTSGYK